MIKLEIRTFGRCYLRFSVRLRSIFHETNFQTLQMIAQLRLFATIRSRLFLKVLAVLSLVSLSVIIAFGISPISQPTTSSSTTISEILEHPASTVSAEDHSIEFVKEEKVRRGDYLGLILERLGVDDPQLQEFIKSSKPIKKSLRLIAGSRIRVIVKADKSVEKLIYFNNKSGVTQISRSGINRNFALTQPELSKRRYSKSGTVEDSLFGAFEKAGLDDRLATEMANIFSSEIDFNRDVRKKDKFSIIFDANYFAGEFINLDKIVAAEYVNAGESHKAFFFSSDKQPSGYYTPDGKSVKRAFLRSPLKFSRITSGFSSGRMHPVLKKWRAHKGVDYGAPTGTEVLSTGRGTVRFVGTKGGYGKFVEIRHSNGITTRYAHLSRYAKGMKSGKRIEQGEVIGYVGKTGLATGPHLHYEFLANGRQINPTKAVMPPGPSITQSEIPEFMNVMQTHETSLRVLANTAIVNADYGE